MGTCVEVVFYFILPDAKHGPVPRLKGFSLANVLAGVVIDFFNPPIGISFRWEKVNGTTVPETTVDEDADFFCTKDNIGLTTECGYRSCVLTKAKTQTMKGTA